MKTCINKNCLIKTPQELDRFSLNAKSKDGRVAECKACVNLRSQKHYRKNKEKVKLNTQRWKAENKETCVANNAAWYLRNKEEYDRKVAIYEKTEVGKSVKRKAWKKRQENGKYNAWYRNKYKTDLNFKILVTLRARQHQALSDKKYNRTMKSTGCSVEFFKQHIASQFTEGMSWDNWGEVWEIDHIKPCAAFDLTIPIEQLKCFHYLNQQPLSVEKNSLKKDFYIKDEIHEKLLEEAVA